VPWAIGAPRTVPSARLRAGDHAVCFYADDDELAAVVAGHLGPAIAGGDEAVVIADPDHCAAFRGALGRAGIDVGGAEAAGRLVVLDAADAVGQFVVRGRPDPAAFDGAVGSVIRRAAATGRPVHAYGEMVALLAGDGHVAGAIELESLWDGLAEQVPFSLLCSYPADLMEEPDMIDAYAEICAGHSQVIAGPPVAEDAEVSRMFPRSAPAPARARRFVTEALRAWGRPDLADDGALVVTEFALNAMASARGGFTVALTRAGRGVRLGVGDTAAAPPQPARSPQPSGLGIVASISARWGHTARPGGKVVWADLGGLTEERGA
jgi:MEDS: MEthanogen/methylotroph, DcmR Sensory domain